MPYTVTHAFVELQDMAMGYIARFWQVMLIQMNSWAMKSL